MGLEYELDSLKRDLEREVRSLQAEIDDLRHRLTSLADELYESQRNWIDEKQSPR